MKTRNGFVSNSSVSSFICDVCGNNVSGHSMGLYEAEMSECLHGHTFCNEHMVQEPEWEEGSIEAEEWDYGSNLPQEYCPICMFQEISERDAAKYLYKIHGIHPDEAFQSLKALNKRRKKLYDGEYITYVCTKKNINPLTLLSKVKDQFKTYDKYVEFLRS